MALDTLADVYYDVESGEPMVADAIKALDGQQVRLAGYMVPFNSLENLKEFMLMPSSNGCNFCQSPMKEEMVYIRQKGKKNFQYIAEPLVITGTLWVNGAGTEAPNSTYDQFLYALRDAKVEKLEQKHYNLLETVTPRTIVKQVCSLLKVRLLKQVSFRALPPEQYHQAREELLLQYLGGATQYAHLQRFFAHFSPDQNLLELGGNYLASWSGAFSNAEGTVISYRDDLDLSDPEHQRQIAMACYDLLFHHEIDMGNRIHLGNPSYDERMARLSLILGLRQSFAQFYGSIGLIDMLPMEQFSLPFRDCQELPAPLSGIVQQLLMGNAEFIVELYKSELYQPYTKAISQPPLSMQQILDSALYTQSPDQYEVPQRQGYENRLGAFLANILLGSQSFKIVSDGLSLGDVSRWEVELVSPEEADRLKRYLSENSPKAQVETRDTVVTITVE